MSLAESSSRRGDSSHSSPLSPPLNPPRGSSAEPLETHPQLLINSQRFYPPSFVPSWHLALLSQLQVRGLNNEFRPLLLPPMFNGHPPFSIPPCGYLDFSPNQQMFLPPTLLPTEPVTSGTNKEEGSHTLFTSPPSSPREVSPRPVTSPQSNFKGFSIADLLRVSSRPPTRNRKSPVLGETSSKNATVNSPRLQQFPPHHHPFYSQYQPMIHQATCSDAPQRTQFSDYFDKGSPKSPSNSGHGRSSLEIKVENEALVEDAEQNISMSAENNRYDWLQCTRYKPPKLPRVRRRDTITRRKLGRNPRVPFTSSQLAALETRFRQTQYLSSCDVADMSSLLCLTETRVKIWFQNRRARERRDREARAKGLSSQTSNLQPSPGGTPLPQGVAKLTSSSSSAFSPVGHQLTGQGPHTSFETSPPAGAGSPVRRQSGSPEVPLRKTVTLTSARLTGADSSLYSKSDASFHPYPLQERKSPKKPEEDQGFPRSASPSPSFYHPSLPKLEATTQSAINISTTGQFVVTPKIKKSIEEIQSIL